LETSELRRSRVIMATKYYEYKDNPAKWEYKKFPVVLKNKKKRVVYDLFDFFTEAVPISQKEFLRMKDDL
jgi:hypothetical protein